MSETATNRLDVGDAAPEFTLPDADGNPLALADYRGRRVIIYFYPAALTPGCTTEACGFRDNLDDLASAGYTVLGISPDKPAKLVKFREAKSLTFPLLSDPDKEALAAYGAYGEKKTFGKTTVGVIRSTFVVNEEGRIDRAYYNVKATAHVSRLLRDLAPDR